MHHLYRYFILAITAAQLAAAQYTNPSFANFSGPNGLLVDLGYVKVQSTHVTSASIPLNAWLGVRYSASPGGQNRFKAPIAIEGTLSAHATFDASTFGPYCYQTFVDPAQAASSLPLLGLGNRQPRYVIFCFWSHSRTFVREPGFPRYPPNIRVLRCLNPEESFTNIVHSEDCLLMDIYAPANLVSKARPVLLLIHGGAYVLGSSTTESTLGLLAAAPGPFITVQMQYRLGGFGSLGGSDIQTNGNLNAGLLD